MALGGAGARLHPVAAANAVVFLGVDVTLASVFDVGSATNAAGSEVGRHAHVESHNETPGGTRTKPRRDKMKGREEENLP
jgi:hypothetical protein